MISPPLVQVQCDQIDAETRHRCQRAQTMTLPSFTGSREATAALFTAVNGDWWIAPETLAVFCPQCRCRSVAQAREARAKGAA